MRAMKRDETRACHECKQAKKGQVVGHPTVNTTLSLDPTSGSGQVFLAWEAVRVGSKAADSVYMRSGCGYFPLLNRAPFLFLPLKSTSW